MMCKCKMLQAALRQFSQVPKFEMMFPPPFCWASSEKTAWAQESHILAISLSDQGFGRLRSNILSFEFTFTERSSSSSLSKQPRGEGDDRSSMQDNKLMCMCNEKSNISVNTSMSLSWSAPFEYIQERTRKQISCL